MVCEPGITAILTMNSESLQHVVRSSPESGSNLVAKALDDLLSIHTRWNMNTNFVLIQCLLIGWCITTSPSAIPLLRSLIVKS